MKWIEKSINDMADFYNSKSIKPSGLGAFPAYGSNGLIGYSEKYLYDNAIVIGRVGANCGSLELVKSKFWPSDNTIVLQPGKYD